MNDDVQVDLYECEGHVIDTMLKHGIRCEALASVPLGECWWIWGAQWSGELPKGFYTRKLFRDSPYYTVGMFTEGICGRQYPLNEAIKK